MRQRARWAEGHTYTVKRYFREIIRSKFLSRREKLEFLYLTPYYLNSFFFIIGTLCWLIAELLHAKIPFWTSILGWSLVFTNLIAVPLVNLTGLFLEYRASRHWAGALCFIPLMRILALSQAVASLRGLFEERESAWFRTLKTGRITELNIFYHLRRFLRREKKRRKIEKKVWTILIILPLMLAIARLIQVDIIGSMLQNSSIFTAFMIPLIIIICISIHYRRKTTYIKPMIVKMMALATVTMFILTLATTTPTQAYIPQQTLYFYREANEFPGTPPGTLSPNSYNTEGSVPLSFGRTYWWATDGTYDITLSDSGIWWFIFEGHNPRISSQKGYIEIKVSTLRNDPGITVGNASFDVPRGEFSREVPVNVQFTSDCNECYIQVILKVGESGSPREYQMYTGAGGRYTVLIIPENIFLLLMILPVLLYISSFMKAKTRPKPEQCR